MYKLLTVLFVAVSASLFADTPPPPGTSLPDVGSSALLLGAAVVGLVAGRRLFSKR